MRNFNDRGRSGGGYSGRSGGGGFRDKEMFRATCDDCGQSCEVPFKPTGNKPVYCSNCFKRNDRQSDSRGFGGRDSGRRPFGGDKQMFEATCDKCGKRCEVPFRPTGEKPVYCSDCFGQQDGRGGRRDSRPSGRGSSSLPKDAYMEQFALINGKLDLILDAIYFEDVEEEEVEVTDKKADKKAKKEVKADKKEAKTEKKVDKKEKKASAKKATKKAVKKAPAKKKAQAKKKK